MVTTAYKSGDTVPLRATLPEDLSDASSVEFKLSETEGGTPVVSGNAVIEDASGGVVGYQWDTDETDRTGEYYMEWEVTYSDGGIETFPRRGFDVLYFYEDLS